MRTLLSVILIFSAINSLLAQEEIDSILDQSKDNQDILETFLPQPVVTPVTPDSMDVKRFEHKAFWRAGAEVVGMNLGLWAFDRYIQKGEFAYISWETVKENFRHGFEWDNDHLSTNMFAHPYNGSLFYNAGRSNGYNFWQSSLFAIGGSAMWEMFMEKEYPSTNDIIATPIGGAAIGEVLYRTSDLVIDDRATGAERFGRELAGFIISPMRGVTRIVTGKAWQRSATSGKRFGIPPVKMSFSLGTRVLFFNNEKNFTRAGLTGRINIEYGEKFEEKTNYPYDYFTFLIDLDVIKTQPLLNRFEIQGRLLSREILDSKNSKLSLGLYQHFDYFDSDTISSYVNKWPFDACLVPYKFGTPASIGGGALGQYRRDGLWQIDGYAHVNAIVLGGILSDFYRNYHRNYNWGMGFSLKGGFKFIYPKWRLTAGADARFYRLYSLKGYKSNPQDHPEIPEPNVQGDASNASFFNLSGNLNYMIWPHVYASVLVDWYRRYTHYTDLVLQFTDSPSKTPFFAMYGPIFTSNQIGLKIMLTYQF
ncbi:MAG: DUF3943 domain-containing protein [Muribaculaceae bacterium]|nr:DUF3943 domain-containing protein [Muribaculaceae bacterium]